MIHSLSLCEKQKAADQVSGELGEAMSFILLNLLGNCLCPQLMHFIYKTHGLLKGAAAFPTLPGAKEKWPPLSFR